MDDKKYVSLREEVSNYLITIFYLSKDDPRILDRLIELARREKSMTYQK